jgi:hypothetical protein
MIPCYASILSCRGAKIGVAIRGACLSPGRESAATEQDSALLDVFIGVKGVESTRFAPILVGRGRPVF